MKELIKRLNLLEHKNWRIGSWQLFEDETDFYQFLKPMSFFFFISSPFLGLILYFMGIFAALAALFIVGVAAFPFAYLAQMFVRSAGSAGASILYRRFHTKNHRAIIKGKYKSINGLEGTGKLKEAIAEYKSFITEYPKELNARFCLARLYDEKMDDPERGLIEYKKLARVIKEKKVDYKYKETLEERIKELKEYLKDKKSNSILKLCAHVATASPLV